MSFFRVLMVGGVVDSVTRPKRYGGLLVGGLLSAVGGVGLLFPASLSLRMLGVLLIVLGILMLFVFAIAAKLYGYVAVGGFAALVALCFGLLQVGKTDDRPRPEVVPAEQRRAVAASDRHAMVTESGSSAGPTKTDGVLTSSSGHTRPISPAAQPVPRAIEEQVYLDPEWRQYHTSACPETKARRMSRARETLATMQGYTRHTCFGLTKEQAPAIIEESNAGAVESTTTYGMKVLGETPAGASSPSSAPSGGKSRSDGTVHVSGYTTTSGTTVAPYTRAAPRKP